MTKTMPGKTTVAVRVYPEFERLFSAEPSPLPGRIETTCRALDRIKNTGTPAEKRRAALAMTAYGRSLDLIQRVRVELDAEKGES